MKAVILAGGHGTRLRPLTYTTPKPMLPLAGKPVLHHIIESLASQGFDDIVVTTNYLREKIMDYFGDGSRFGVKLIYPREEKPLGTAGGVKNAARYLNETFAVIQGDNITDIEFKELLHFHEQRGGIGTIALIPKENPQQFGIAELDPNNQIIKFKEKPRCDERFSNLVNTGLYVLEPEILDYVPSGLACDFAQDVFPTLLRSKRRIYGYPAQGFWVDIGNPESYMEAVHWILSKLRGRMISETAEVSNASIKGWVKVGEETRIEPKAMIRGPAIVGDRCSVKRGAKIARHSVIESNVEVSAKTRITSSIIYENTSIGDFSGLNHCIVAEQCRVGSGVKIKEMSVIGAQCEIGDRVSIHKGSRIWPRIKIEMNSIIRGVVRYWSK